MTALQLATVGMQGTSEEVTFASSTSLHTCTLSEEYAIGLVASRLWSDQSSILGSLSTGEYKFQGHYFAAEITPVVTLLVMALIVQ